MLLVNVNTKQFIPSAGSNFIQPVESRDQIIYGTRVEVRFQLYNPDGTVFVLNESDTFCCGGDNNFVHTDDLMFYSGHEMCRIIDAAQGIVGVTIDATSDSFADKATSQNTRMYVQLKRHVAGDTLGDTVLQDIVYAQPAVMTTEGAPASSDPEYMTAAATLALFRTAPDYQFSADGETGWHDEQDIAADRFYRERRNGGEWGPAIELIEGKTGPTGAAAGFGTPTVAVESLPAGSDATASVTASGDNTAKVFSFNFGIPKGADGQNGTNGADGAAGADGVSSYTYVAYASDASGAGFSLTPSNALKFRAEIHTTTAIETPDADDFAGATWVKYIGDDGAGAGDMTKAVYDTNDDGIVDHAATADAVGATTAAQVADAVGKAHTHANKTTLDKLAETNGKLTYDGAEIGGGSGTVKSVNGQLPDESGNVTIETNAFGEWINFEPSGQVMLTHNFNDRFAVGILQLLDADGRIYSLNDRVTYNTNYINIDYTGLLLTGTHKARFFNSSASMGGLQPPAGALALYENYSGGNWADSSGNGYDLTASGSITAQNGEAFFPDATGKLLSATNWPLGNKVTFSVVVSAQDRVCWFGCSKGILGIFNNGFTFGKTNTLYGHSAQIPTAVLSGKFHLLMTLNGTSVQYYLNGEQMELSGTDDWTTDTVDGLGNVYTNYPFTSHTIAHCAIYNSILTAEDISKCWNYVKAKYNL